MASQSEFLSNELLQGELLSEKLAAGALLAEESLRYGIQIGRALAAAHARGVIHGRLSPDHILISADGAHLLSARVEASGCDRRYRAPEQVRGEPADWRSDIFSYGILLYEMASGKHAFEGQGAELDDAILYRRPAALMPNSPIHVAMERVIEGCLEKNPAMRRQRTQNAVIELKLARHLHRSTALKASRRQQPARGQAAEPGALPTAASPARQGSWAVSRPILAAGLRRRLTVIGLAILALAATGLAAVLYLHQRHPAPAMKFSIAAPEHTRYPGTPSVSPDGRLLTFSAMGADGSRMLWLRALDESHSGLIEGTEGGFAPFWSPDSEWIAFFANKALKRLRVGSGPSEPKVETIAEVEAEPGGGTWNRDGVILFAPGMNGGLYRVPAAGGKVAPALMPDLARSEQAFLWPQFLPDGRHFIFFNETGTAETTGVYAGGLAPATKRLLFPSETNAVYSPAAGVESSNTGYLLFVKDRDLMVRTFDAGRLEISGEDRPLSIDLGSIRTLSLAPLSVSANAVLVYQTVEAAVRQLSWKDRNGKDSGMLGEGAGWGPPRISPDGSRVAVSKMNEEGKSDLWILDPGGNATEFVKAANTGEGSPTWSPYGGRIAFWSDPEGVCNLYWKAIAGTRPGLLYGNGDPKFPTDWSRDGRFLLFDEITAATNRDVMGMELADAHVTPILNTANNEGHAALSPDGKWLAFQSDESGRNEVYVQPFDGLNAGTKRRWKISSDPGSGQSGLPRWRGDGRELFYITSTGIVMSAGIHVENGEFGFDPPTILFQSRPIPKTWNWFDVARDGQRFLVNLPLERPNSSVITVMTNWTEKLKS